MSSHFIFWIFAIIIIFIFISGIKMVKEYERVVVFRLGRFSGLKGPGLFWIIPWVDRVRLIDLRTQVVDVPRQEAITKDNIPVIVNAAIFYSVNDPAKAVIRVQNYQYAISQIAQTTLRSVIGGGNLDELVS
ncbi:MAG: slipin family protein, partial [Candidatus Heimdallarchaeota archaeon]|nr:slipin family protein [Candidatus Heimdallarchaeota archaeon]